MKIPQDNMTKRRITYRFFQVLAFLIMTTACGGNAMCRKKQTINFEADTLRNFKNPYMGWTLYSESRKRHIDGTDYWQQQDEAASKYASVFYLRWKWEEVEPEEGKYAWENDSVFINLIQGALDRNLRLAFRIFTHTGTPKYVLDGAETYEHWGKQTPFADDEFFLEKYTKFIEAFGKKFNNPAIVDYVDCYGMGWWGEGHNIKYKDQTKKDYSHDKLVKTYAKVFDKVINVINFGVRNAHQDSVVYDELSFSPRRDGYASKWFPKKDQEALVNHFPNKPIIAEACYWGKNDISYHIENEDGKKYWDTWQEYYADVVDLALATHANYLDMRTVDETKRYMDNAQQEAQKFLTHGGYRIYPSSISYSTCKESIFIEHTWENKGVGVLPNNNRNLKNKYKVSFALFDSDQKIVEQWYSEAIDLSKVVGKMKTSASDEFTRKDLGKKKYQLGVAIVNTKENDSKDISLAVKNAAKITGEWILVGEL